MKAVLRHGETVKLPEPLVIESALYSRTENTVILECADSDEWKNYKVGDKLGQCVFGNFNVMFRIVEEPDVVAGSFVLLDGATVSLPDKLIHMDIKDDGLWQTLEYSYSAGQKLTTYQVKVGLVEHRGEYKMEVFCPFTKLFFKLVPVQ